MDIPSVYQAGYEKARALNPQLAATYVRHTMIDAPVADAAIDALAACGQKDVHQFIHAGMEQDVRALAAAPQPLRDFFDSIDTPPPWFDPASVDAGCRAFHQYSDLFIPAFIVVTLQNFTSLMSKVFYMTGRVTTPHGLRRIRQNTRHLVEIMLPGALERQGEGWKLSVRIRLVHARVRWLLRASGNWDEAVYGVPLSAAHMGLAAANFSATMLHQAERLGARLDAEARASFMQTWRYASWLAGTPEALLFEGDEAKTSELSRVATVCEPFPAEEAAVVSNAVINALPHIANLTDPAAQKAMIDHGYRVSRALLGKEMSDRLQLPRQQVAGLLTWMHWKRRLYGFFSRLAPQLARKWQANHFVLLLDASTIGDFSYSYRLPDHLEATKASPW